ncbi:hypothetical protein [Chitinophaga sp. 22620]|uniref:hypothetical protein n=1 Tax=Chitinophaga sp. 22620 TaxID=3453952 RepID=UPI003F853410
MKRNAKFIADCYQQDVDVIDAGGTLTNVLVLNEARNSIIADLLVTPYLNEDIVAFAIEPCDGRSKFCCARFTLLHPSTQGVPVKMVGGISGKWSVIPYFHF